MTATSIPSGLRRPKCARANTRTSSATVRPRGTARPPCGGPDGSVAPAAAVQPPGVSDGEIEQGEQHYPHGIHEMPVEGRSVHYHVMLLIVLPAQCINQHHEQ